MPVREMNPREWIGLGTKCLEELDRNEKKNLLKTANFRRLITWLAAVYCAVRKERGGDP